MNRYEVHPAAEIPPPLDDDDYKALLDSVRQHGQQHPIILYEDQIIDGRHRYQACCELGIPPRVEHYAGSLTPLEIVKLNLARRHLTPGQKAVVGLSIEKYEAELAKQRQVEALLRGNVNRHQSPIVANLPQLANEAPTPQKQQNKARERAAAATGASARNVQKAKKIASEAPDLLEKVRAGSVSLNAAEKQLKERKHKDELQKQVDVLLPDGLHVGDFRELAAQIPDNSIELVFTDPPYDRDSLPLYADAARIAARILKPGGSFIAYTGQVNLPGVLVSCSEHLRYWWTIAGVHSGGANLMHKYGIRCGWKPLVWFVKGHRGDVQSIISDVVTGDREKTSHEWQQAEAEARYYIDKLSTPGGVVVDFFGGGGTTMAAAVSLARRCIMFEINPVSAEKIAKRLAE